MHQGMGPIENLIVHWIVPLYLQFFAPLSVPPLPPDAAMQRAVPPSCICYLSAAGLGTVDPASDHPTEKILAHPATQQFLGDCHKQFQTIAGLVSHKPDVPWAEFNPRLIEFFLSAPQTFWLEDFSFEPGPGLNPMVGSKLHWSAGCVLKCGDQLAEVKKIFDDFNQKVSQSRTPAKTITIAGNPFQQITADETLTWGFYQDYLLIAVGDGTAEKVVERLGNAKAVPPAWLGELQAKSAPQRCSCLMLVDTPKLLKAFEPVMPPDARPVAVLLKGVGRVSLARGLDEHGYVLRKFVAIPNGDWPLLSCFSPKPLTADDFAQIPMVCTFATVARVDLEQVLAGVVETSNQVSPGSGDKVRMQANMAVGTVGLDLQKDLLAPLGDLWTFSNTADPAALEGASLVASISLRDAAAFTATEAKLLALVNQLPPQMKESFQIADAKVGDLPAHEIGFRGLPIKFQWCITPKGLMIGNAPGAIEQRLAGGLSLATEPSVAGCLSTKPCWVTYFDDRKMMPTVPQLFQGLGLLGAQLSQDFGVKIEVPRFDRAAELQPLVGPTTYSLRRTDKGLAFVRSGVMPLSVMELGGAVGGMAGGMQAVAKVRGGTGQGLLGARGQARHYHLSNNLHQLGIAALNYESNYSRFPAGAITDKEGHPLLSWRVSLLPFLEQKTLYDQFHLDEPWDSEHNRALIAKMPDIFENPNVSGPANGKTTIFANPLLLTAKGLKIREILDGTSKTILFVVGDASQAVEWTRPEPWELELANFLQGAAAEKGKITVAFCDASIHELPATIRPEDFKALLTPDGGEAVNAAQFRP